MNEKKIDLISHAASNSSALAQLMGIHQNFIHPISVVKNISKNEFNHNFLEKEGRPCIVEDAMTKWKATEWTFDFLKSRFSSMEISVQPSLRNKTTKYTLQLSDYIDYVTGEKKISDLKDIDGNEIQTERLYALAFHPFVKYPELFEEFDETPYFIDDYFSGLIGHRFQSILRHFRHHWMFIGPKGSLSQFHSDHHFVMTYLAQVKGIKLAILVSPQETDKIISKESALDPFSICAHLFPDFQKVNFHFAVLKPGQMLFVPKAWNHYVLGLSPSITLSKDMVNAYNFGDYFLNMFVKDLPYLAGNINSFSESVKKDLGIRWTVADRRM